MLCTSPKPEFKLSELKAIFTNWNDALATDGWNTIYFGNHDNPRMLSRFGNTEEFRDESAKMLATILLTLRGTPYLFQGDEIGMSNAKFKNISEFNDVQVLNAFQTLVTTGPYTEKEFLDASNKIARDHARTPFQWNSSKNAGFTEGIETWLMVNNNYQEVNVESQEKNSNSTLNYYKKLIILRKNTPALIYGNYVDLRPECDEIWLYERNFENEKYLIMNNFKDKIQSFEITKSFYTYIYLIGNYDEPKENIETIINLKPYESRIYIIKQLVCR